MLCSRQNKRQYTSEHCATCSNGRQKFQLPNLLLHPLRLVIDLFNSTGWKKELSWTQLNAIDLSVVDVVINKLSQLNAYRKWNRNRFQTFMYVTGVPHITTCIPNYAMSRCVLPQCGEYCTITLQSSNVRKYLQQTFVFYANLITVQRETCFSRKTLMRTWTGKYLPIW
jgi:hypothetical protein